MHLRKTVKECNIIVLLINTVKLLLRHVNSQNRGKFRFDEIQIGLSINVYLKKSCIDYIFQTSLSDCVAQTRQ